MTMEKLEQKTARFVADAAAKLGNKR